MRGAGESGRGVGLGVLLGRVVQEAQGRDAVVQVGGEEGGWLAEGGGEEGEECGGEGLQFAVKGFERGASGGGEVGGVDVRFVEVDGGMRGEGGEGGRESGGGAEFKSFFQAVGARLRGEVAPVGVAVGGAEGALGDGHF